MPSSGEKLFIICSTKHSSLALLCSPSSGFANIANSFYSKIDENLYIPASELLLVYAVSRKRLIKN